MRSIVWLIVGVALGCLVTMIALEKGGASQRKAQKAYVNQVRTDVAFEQQATVNDLQAKISPSLSILASLDTASLDTPRKAKTEQARVIGNLMERMKEFADIQHVDIAQRPLHKPEWQIHIDWAFENQDAGGATNCVAEYLSYGQASCVIAGGRSCVMNNAKNLITNLADFPAVKRVVDLTALTQCHNSEAKGVILAHDYLETARYVKNH